jgi:hypothetical protein
MNLTDAFRVLKFCPVCGYELVKHPELGKKLCWRHGEFKVTQEKDRTHATVEFRMTGAFE